MVFNATFNNSSLYYILWQWRYEHLSLSEGTPIFNNSTNISKTNNHLSPQLIEHKKDDNMWHDNCMQRGYFIIFFFVSGVMPSRVTQHVPKVATVDTEYAIAIKSKY